MLFDPNWIQAAASLGTMVAAIAALTIAIRAPRLAAEFAERYRRQSAKEDEAERFRLNVFVMLMKHRSEIMAQDARAAINLVDVAFSDVADVRDARRLFIEATRSVPHNPTTIVERYHALIESVARAMPMREGITGFDVRSGYYPEALSKMDEAAILDAEEKIAKRNAGRLRDLGLD